MAWEDTIKRLPDASYISNFPKPKSSLISRSKKNLDEEKRLRHKESQSVTSKCEVKSCGAVSCINNKNMKCTLTIIYVDDNGLCQQFTKKV